MSLKKKKGTRKVARSSKGRKLGGDQAVKGIDERLSKVAAGVLAGHRFEDEWELFRLQYFPGWKHTKVAGTLGAWAQRHGIKVEFEVRKHHDFDLHVLFVRLSAR